MCLLVQMRSFEGLSYGARSIVAAGSVVLAWIASRLLVKGNPAVISSRKKMP